MGVFMEECSIIDGMAIVDGTIFRTVAVEMTTSFREVLAWNAAVVADVPGKWYIDSILI